MRIRPPSDAGQETSGQASRPGPREGPGRFTVHASAPRRYCRRGALPTARLPERTRGSAGLRIEWRPREPVTRPSRTIPAGSNLRSTVAAVSPDQVTGPPVRCYGLVADSVDQIM
jgi:hypothetical protein